MPLTNHKKPSPAFSWILYDWANSAFATTVMAGFFPIFFKNFYSTGSNPTESTAKLGLASSAGTLALALLAPLLGGISDYGPFKKRFLAFFTLLGAIGTAALTGVHEGAWMLAIFFYTLASIGFGGSSSFYDALLPSVSTPDNVHRVSGNGFAAGYLGGGILFALNVAMVQKPNWFHLSGPAQAVQISFLMVSIWWLVFSIPLFAFVPEPIAQTTLPVHMAVRRGFREIWHLFRELRNQKTLAFFLVAYFIYNDGVSTTIKMAVDYGMSIGLGSGDLITALLLVQWIGFPFALLFGRWAHRLPPKTILLFCIMVYLGVTVWASQMHSAREFYILAALIGMVQGGIQSISRSLYARLIPNDRSGEFFGLFNLLGRFSGIIGPALVGWVSWQSGNPRIGILSTGILFLVGFGLLKSLKLPSSPSRSEPL